MAEQEVAAPVVVKPNPYLAELATELNGVLSDHLSTEDALTLARHVLDQLTRKNERIHVLSMVVARLESQIGQLGKTLDKHSPGEWHKNKESAIECARRLLSPVRDDAATRDRP